MTPLPEALTWLIAHTSRPGPETIPLAQALHRILACDTPLDPAPQHPTAAIAGLALRAATTDGASDYTPLPVQGTQVAPGDPLPPDTDAILPDTLHDGGAALAPIARGHGVAPPGHDIPEGTILAAGTRLTPLHLACLTRDPAVFGQPRIQADAPFLRALLHAIGANTTSGTPDLILQTTPLARTALDGLAIRPGETTALGHSGATPAIRLPAHPAEAAAVVALLVAPLLRHLLLQPEPTPTRARLTRKIASTLGQHDAVRVRLEDDQATPLGPGLLAAAASHGWVFVPEGSEGYPAGATVPIYPP